MSNVSQIRQGPTVSDVPGQLRLMADRVEAGEVEAPSILCIVPQSDDWPMIFGWGEHLGDHANIGICELAKAWFVHNTTVR